MKKVFAIVACMLVVGNLVFAQERFSAADQYPDVRVIESTQSGVTFEFTPRYRASKSIVFEGKNYQDVSFEKSSTWSYSDAGKPDVRFRTIAVGAPGRLNTHVSVVAADYETVNGFSLSPVPIHLHNAEKDRPDGASRPSASTDGFFPSNIAILDNVSMVKNIPVGYLKIYPVQYNSGTSVMRKYSRIVVHVEFGPHERLAANVKDDEWMRSSLLNYPVAKRFLQSGSSISKKTTVNSILSTGNWFKLEVRDDGIYKIDATYLRTLGIDRASISSMRDLKIYGNNGLVVPPDLLQSRPADLTQQAAVYHDTNGNSKFDDDDYILFYGQGVTGWTYSPGDKEFTHYTNPYTNSNYYFLQYLPQSGNGKQMSVVQAPGSGGRVNTTRGKVFFDEERTNVTQSGLEWYSAPMNPNDSRVIVNKLDGYSSGTPVRYKYELLSRADVTAEFDFQETNTPIASLFVSGFPQETLDDPASDFASRGQGEVTAVPAITENRSALKINYSASSATAKGYINWVEIFYTQQLAAVNDAIIFTSPDTTGAAEFALTGFLGNPLSVFDITDLFDVKVLAPVADQLAGSYFLRDNLVGGSIKRYWAGTASAFKTPVSFTRIPNTNLRGGISGADFIIVTHRDFLSEALRLKAYKESLPGGDALKTFVVEVDTIYNEFGGGMPDPTSIRDFLEYTFTTWQPKPGYVLFFGDACFDFKNNLGVSKNWVPTYQSPESNQQIYTYGYDDFYAYLQPGDNSNVSIAHGRLAARSAAEARLMVDRIIQYETAPVYGSWKNLITIAADDRNINGELDGAENPEQAENLAQSYVPKLFEVKKIYENDYPTVIAASGRRKPAARQAILDQINRGTLVLNFTGHGNPTVWSHESILTKDDVITQLSNRNTLTCIVAATCDWGRFDEATDQSSAEEVMINSSGGAIGVISADRAVFSGDNAQTNYALYSHLFSANSFTRTLPLGDGLMLAKNDHTGDLVNNRKYHLLGDPTLRLAVPRQVMQIDSINGTPISVSSFDTLQALSKVTIKASVRDQGGSIQNIKSDSSLVSVFDAAQRDTVYDDGLPGGYMFSFIKPGAVIYKGDNSIKNGLLSATFIIPKDISYENKQGRISVYFSGNGVDGRGYTDRVIVGGTSQNVGTDIQGPSIRIFLDSRSFRSGDLVSENPTLIVDLTDSSGINAAGSGVGHRLEAWIDADSKSSDLTEFYKGAKDNYQAGSIEYQLADITPGRHTVRVRGWDVYNNSSIEQVEFSVASSTALSLENVYNIPNPVRTTTAFTFQHNQLSSVDVEIKIYTVSGRLIQTISNQTYTERFVQIPWDCRDRDGSKIANGTYLYKLVVKTVDGKFTSEALGKMSIVR